MKSGLYLRFEHSGDGQAVALIQQVGRVRIAEVELVIEVDAARHHVLGKRISSLESKPSAEPSLGLDEEGIVVVDAGANQRIDLTKAGCQAMIILRKQL